MKEQLIEKLNAEILHIFESGANEIRVLNMVEAFINKYYEYEALTSVKSEPMNYESQKAIQDNLVESYPFKKSESAEEVLNTAYQSVLGDINREEIEELKTEDSEEGRMFRATIQAMHDFANNSEAMKENAIKFAKYITNNKNNEWDKLYNIYLTNKEK